MIGVWFAVLIVVLLFTAWMADLVLFVAYLWECWRHR